MGFCTERGFVMNKILIADDDISRSILHEIFDKQYDVIDASNGEEVIEVLKSCYDELDLLLLAFDMPVKNGLDVLQFMDNAGILEKVPTIVITLDESETNIDKALGYGVFDIITKPFDKRLVMKRAKNIIELSRNIIEVQNYTRKLALESTIRREKLELKMDAFAQTYEDMVNRNELLVNIIDNVLLGKITIEEASKIAHSCQD